MARLAAGLMAPVLFLAFAAAAGAQEPVPSPTATPAPAAGCVVTSAGLLCPQLPAGCAVTSAGLLCPGAVPGAVAGEEATSPPRRRRREPEPVVSPVAAKQAAPVPLRRLAFTGFEGLPVALAGALLLAGGVALRRRVRA